MRCCCACCSVSAAADAKSEHPHGRYLDQFVFGGKQCRQHNIATTDSSQASSSSSGMEIDPETGKDKYETDPVP